MGNEKIEKNEKLVLDPTLRTDKITIFRTCGKPVNVCVGPQTIVLELKRLIQESTGTPAIQIQLLFIEINLENYRTMEHYKIKDGSNIHMVLLLRGGMYTELSGRNGGYSTLNHCMFVIPTDSPNK